MKRFVLLVSTAAICAALVMPATASAAHLGWKYYKSPEAAQVNLNPDITWTSLYVYRVNHIEYYYKTTVATPVGAFVLRLYDNYGGTYAFWLAKATSPQVSVLGGKSATGNWTPRTSSGGYVNIDSRGDDKLQCMASLFGPFGWPSTREVTYTLP
jgi:hypothetical protein